MALGDKLVVDGKRFEISEIQDRPCETIFKVVLDTETGQETAGYVPAEIWDRAVLRSETDYSVICRVLKPLVVAAGGSWAEHYHPSNLSRRHWVKVSVNESLIEFHFSGERVVEVL